MTTRICSTLLLLLLAPVVLGQDEEEFELALAISQRQGIVLVKFENDRGFRRPLIVANDQTTKILRSYLHAAFINANRKGVRAVMSGDERKKLDLAATIDIRRLMREFERLRKTLAPEDDYRMVANSFNKRLRAPFGEDSLCWKVEQTLLARKHEQQ